MAPYIGLLLAMLVVVKMLDSSLACDCTHLYHPQSRFCKDEYAFIFKVIANDYVQTVGDEERVVSNFFRDWAPSATNQRFTVENLKIYKNHSRLLSSHYVYSNYDSCGVLLSVGTTYAVVGGHVSQGRLFVYACDQLTDMSRLTPWMQKILLINFNFRYPSGCNNCEVLDCTEIYGRPVKCIPEGPTKDQCYAVNQDSDGYVEYWSFQTVCVRRNSQCVWVKGFKELGPILTKNDTIY